MFFNDRYGRAQQAEQNKAFISFTNSAMVLWLSPLVLLYHLSLPAYAGNYNWDASFPGTYSNTGTGYPQQSSAFTLSGFNVTATGVITPSGSSDYFYGALNVPYMVIVNAGTNLTYSWAIPCMGCDGATSANGKPLGQVIATSGGDVVNYGNLRTFPSSTGTASTDFTLTPTVVAVLDGTNTTTTTITGLKTNALDPITRGADKSVTAANHIINYGVIGDNTYSDTITAPKGAGGANYSFWNWNYAAVAMNSTNGYIYNGPDGIMSGYVVVATSGNGVVDNYGTIATNGDGMLTGFLINNYGVIYNDVNTVGYVSVHSYNAVNQYGVMLGSDYGILAMGHDNVGGTAAGAINIYGGGLHAGLLSYNHAATFNGEVGAYLYKYKSSSGQVLNGFTPYNTDTLSNYNNTGVYSADRSQSIAVMLDWSPPGATGQKVQKLNLIGQTQNGVSYNPIIAGLMSGGYAGGFQHNLPNGNNILDFQLTGLSAGQNTALQNAINQSQLAGNATSGYYGSIALFGVLYQWDGFKPGNIQNDSQTISTLHLISSYDAITQPQAFM
jgi:hypothetical protein